MLDNLSVAVNTQRSDGLMVNSAEKPTTSRHGLANTSMETALASRAQRSGEQLDSGTVMNQRFNVDIHY